MSRHAPAGQVRAGLALAGAALLAGCTSPAARASSPAAQASAPRSATRAPQQTAPTDPSATAHMVCAEETRATLSTMLAGAAVPPGTANWDDPVYTCTFTLPVGRLVISVTEGADSATTSRAFTALQHRLGRTHDLLGLGQASYASSNGDVVLRKGHNILRVDATGLPAQFGRQQQKRTDFAYETASIILGCWTGD